MYLHLSALDCRKFCPNKRCHHGESRKLQIPWSLDNIQPWSKHITEVCRNARQKVNILYRKCNKNCNNATMLKLYLSCIRPELEYAATVWSPHQKGQIDTLESVQKLALYVLGIGTPITKPYSPRTTFQLCPKVFFTSKFSIQYC